MCPPASEVGEETPEQLDFCRDQDWWQVCFAKHQTSLRPPKPAGTVKKLSEHILTETLLVDARFEHLWPDGSAAVSVQHDRIGWLEFDLAKGALPDGTVPGCFIPVRLYLGAHGHVIRHQILPGTRVIQAQEIGHEGDSLEEGLPVYPANPNDQAAMKRYKQEMSAWQEKSGLGKRPNQA